MRAIRAVGRGDLYIHPAMTRALLKDVSPLLASEENPTEPLSPREEEILQGITRGLSNKEIAGRLGISHQTVKNHVTSILRKLNANARTEAVIVAIKQGLITIG